MDDGDVALGFEAEDFPIWRAAKTQHIRDALARLEGWRLREIRDSARKIAARPLTQLLGVPFDRSMRRNQVEQRLNQRGFPAAIWPENREQLARLEIQCDGAKDLLRA